MKRWFIRGVGLLLALVVALIVAAAWIDTGRPSGRPSPEADALAHELEAVVDAEAWRALEAVRWNFGGRHALLWDKRRDLVRVRWGDVEVLRPLHGATGVVTVGGAAVTGAERDALLVKAYALWANDAFWLNPLAKLFDPGTERAIVEVDGERGLLVTYASGGVTPGDAYLWITDGGRPTAWRMWVGIIPIGGLRASWDDWLTLPGGAQVATRHSIYFLDLRLTDVTAGALADIEPGGDPFAAIVGPSPTAGE